MISEVVSNLIAEQRIERVPSDVPAATRILGSALRTLQGAQREERSAPELAYTGAYDAARKAINAHLLAQGLRVPARDGSHKTYIAYAQAELSGVVDNEVLEDLDEMRKIRNHTEYGDRSVSSTEVANALFNAQVVLETITRILVKPS